jgi:hypothetical protein
VDTNGTFHIGLAGGYASDGLPPLASMEIRRRRGNPWFKDQGNKPKICLDTLARALLKGRFARFQSLQL